MKITPGFVSGAGLFIGCRVYNTGNQALATGVYTAITFDSERYDTDGMHSTSSNTSRITINQDGKYHVGACVSYAPHVTGQRFVTIYLNGTTYIAYTRPVSDAADGSYTTLACDYQFSAGDYIEVRMYQNTGGNLNSVFTANAYPEFWAHMIK